MHVLSLRGVRGRRRGRPPLSASSGCGSRRRTGLVPSGFEPCPAPPAAAETLDALLAEIRAATHTAFAFAQACHDHHGRVIRALNAHPLTPERVQFVGAMRHELLQQSRLLFVGPDRDPFLQQWTPPWRSRRHGVRAGAGGTGRPPVRRSAQQSPRSSRAWPTPSSVRWVSSFFFLGVARMCSLATRGRRRGAVHFFWEARSPLFTGGESRCITRMLWFLVRTRVGDRGYSFGAAARVTEWQWWWNFVDSTCATLAPRGGAVVFCSTKELVGLWLVVASFFDFNERRDTLKSRGILWDHQATIGNML